MKKRNFRRIVFSILLTVVVLLTAALFVQPGGAEAAWKSIFRFCGLGSFSDCADGAPFSLHVLSVGKADSILVECGSSHMLVDGGTADRGEDVADYLKNRGIQKLDCVVNTHPDDDHIGGLYTVLNRFSAAQYICPDIPAKLIPNSLEYRNVQAILKERGVNTKHPKANSAFSLGKASVSVLGPVIPGKTTNNNSIVLKITYGTKRFLLMGDAEKEEEESLLNSGADLEADMLKVGHHGSSTSSSAAFLRAVQPKFAAVSVGRDSNNLPRLDVLNRFSNMGISVFRTDISGTTIFLSDGKTIQIKTEK